MTTPRPPTPGHSQGDPRGAASGGHPPPREEPPTSRRGSSFADDLGDHAVDTEMNMTPMIDIVFQLIIFFLLTLKFKTVDERIDANLPKTTGLQITKQTPLDVSRIKVKLFRREAESVDRAHTLLAIDNSHRFLLSTPDIPLVDEHGEMADTREHLEQLLRTKIEALGGGEVHLEIHTPRPTGSLVPHQDVMLVLDAAASVGLEHVKFEGTPKPKFLRDK